MSDAENWPNILLLSQLLFSLLITNSIVEIGFSTMKVLKTERCTWLLTNTLDDLIEINLEGPTQSTFLQVMLYSCGTKTVQGLIRVPIHWMTWLKLTWKAQLQSTFLQVMLYSCGTKTVQGLIRVLERSVAQDLDQRERKALLIPYQQKTSFHLMTGINYLRNCRDYHVVSVTRHCIQV